MLHLHNHCELHFVFWINSELFWSGRWITPYRGLVLKTTSWFHVCCNILCFRGRSWTPGDLVLKSNVFILIVVLRHRGQLFSQKEAIKFSPKTQGNAVVERFRNSKKNYKISSTELFFPLLHWLSVLTKFSTMFHFHTPLKRMKIDHWVKLS